MDPRVSISPQALAEQYALADTRCRGNERELCQGGGRIVGGPTADAQGYDALNDAASALLEIVDGADAPPTAQASAAVSGLEQRLNAVERPR